MLRLLFTKRGRCARGQFWTITLAGTTLYAVFVGVVAYFAAQAFPPELTNAETNNYDISTMLVPLIAATLIPTLIFLWSMLCVTIKRWHDRGKSGWWIFISLAPVIGGAWHFIETGFLPGTPGPNAYGPDPLAARDVPGALGLATTP
ncbi:DUF805 domain-containing protein [Methylobacterium sp. A54F]